MLRDDLAIFFKDKGFKTGAEIGVLYGAYSQFFVDNLKGPIYLIDPYKSYPKEVYYDSTNATQLAHDERRARAIKKFADAENVVFIRKTSAEAMVDFEDESLDFVYIDANHAYPFVIQDVFGWWPKIRKGGVLSGHDFTLVGLCTGPLQAVCDFVKAKEIKKWYHGIDDNFFIIKPDN